jgi:hypothetical protein
MRYGPPKLTLCAVRSLIADEVSCETMTRASPAGPTEPPMVLSASENLRSKAGAVLGRGRRLSHLVCIAAAADVERLEIMLPHAGFSPKQTRPDLY